MKYTAVSARGMRITSVEAESDAEANDRLARVLQRPGRWDAFKCWVRDGRQVILDDDPASQRPLA